MRLDILERLNATCEQRLHALREARGYLLTRRGHHSREAIREGWERRLAHARGTTDVLSRLPRAGEFLFRLGRPVAVVMEVRIPNRTNDLIPPAEITVGFTHTPSRRTERTFMQGDLQLWLWNPYLQLLNPPVTSLEDIHE